MPCFVVVGIIIAIILIMVISKNSKEQKRQQAIEAQRTATPPYYSDGVSRSEFEGIVFEASRSIPRIRNVSVNGYVVYITVVAVSGISEWTATVDFNDFGRLTGWYKVTSTNKDSNVPDALAREINARINTLRMSRPPLYN